MIKIRIDVDYPYPSRAKSFLTIALRIKSRKSKDYLRNARVIAKMVNDSPKQVKAYWFFTPYTLPDKQLLDLLVPDRHEVALHVATDAAKEWKNLEQQTSRKIQFYTIHGTQRLFARLLWGRKFSQAQAIIPSDFQLTSFHDFTTTSLDRMRYLMGFEAVVEEAKRWVEQDVIMEVHPEWLYTANKKTKRGPYYDALKAILDVDHDLDTVSIHHRLGVRIARDYTEYHKSIIPTDDLVFKLKRRGADIFTFIERKWCCPLNSPPLAWKKSDDNIGLLTIKDYDSWWNAISKKTRNMVRKAEKEGVEVSVVPQNDMLAEGIWKIYNETPIRQGRAFPHYGEPLDHLTKVMYLERNSTYLAAFFEGQIIGFIQLTQGENLVIISNILSMQKHMDKAVNNALLAKAVEVCASRGEKWLMYGRIGNHPSLDKFKENNGFVKYPLNRYYIPLTVKGRLAISLGLQRELKDSLPQSIKGPLIPVFNWVSRNKVRLRKVG